MAFKFGQELAKLRRERGMTQQQVADYLGVTPSRVGILEHQGNMRVSTIKNYIAALGGTVTFIADMPVHGKIVLKL